MSIVLEMEPGKLTGALVYNNTDEIMNSVKSLQTENQRLRDIIKRSSNCLACINMASKTELNTAAAHVYRILNELDK